MDRCLLLLLFVAATAAVSYADLSPEQYWKKLLPNTPIPDSILQKLQPEVNDEKAATSVNVGKGGVTVDTGKAKPAGGTTVNVGKGGVNVNAGKGKPTGTGTRVNVGKGGVNVNTGKGKPTGGSGSGTGVNVGKGGVSVNAGKGKPTGKGNTNVHVGKGGVNVNTGHKGKPVVVNVKPGANPFVYHYAASEDQVHGDSDSAVFFLEKDLHQGTTFRINLHSADPSSTPAFLPRKDAAALPLSSSNLDQILHGYSIQANSEEAKTVAETIKECEAPALKNEAKYCATSLESMVDFVRTRLGTRAKALSTGTTKAGKQTYTIAASGVKRMPSSRMVACHPEAYVHALYYCHETSATRAYLVPLVGEKREKVEAVAVCHEDTSEWNPRHLAFMKLKVKPGSVPICHFVPSDHLVWVQN